MHISCLEWFREKDIAAISWDMMDERPTSYPGFAMSTHLAIPFLGWILSIFVFYGSAALWLVLMFKAYQGERFKLPVAGDIAEQRI